MKYLFLNMQYCLNWVITFFFFPQRQSSDVINNRKAHWKRNITTHKLPGVDFVRIKKSLKDCTPLKNYWWLYDRIQAQKDTLEVLQVMQNTQSFPYIIFQHNLIEKQALSSIKRCNLTVSDANNYADRLNVSRMITC